MWTDVLEDFRNTCLKLCNLDPARIFTVSGLAWQAALKLTRLKLDILNDINMLLMIKKGITGGICHAIHWYVKAKNKYMKDYGENIET